MIIVNCDVCGEQANKDNDFTCELEMQEIVTDLETKSINDGKRLNKMKKQIAISNW